MKKAVYIALAACAALLSGCSPDENAWSRKGPDPKLDCEFIGYDMFCNAYGVVKVKGHEYVAASGARCVSVVHSESCPCKGAAAAKPAAPLPAK